MLSSGRILFLAELLTAEFLREVHKEGGSA